MKIKIHIPGQPIGKGRAKSRIVTAKSGKQFTNHYTPAKTRNYENEIASYAQMAMQGKQRMDGPVKITLIFVFGITQSWPQWKKDLAMERKLAPTVKPDSSNILKAIEDACNEIVFKDDTYIIDTIMKKRYGDKPGVHVLVEELDQYSAQIKRKP